MHWVLAMKSLGWYGNILSGKVFICFKVGSFSVHGELTDPKLLFFIWVSLFSHVIADLHFLLLCFIGIV